ncbi:omptin family outer membrane protease [Spirochaeta thermophila]|uniref:Hypothetical membrane protein n=1 Tax=Winmispira thermophila (strain ATCC 49972 / DSM 6192 / RI 19.B1) TaxID=665571 RepID=E0RP87_WINT6|nr:omptin family outer membrane protease [Spirochaeta thermophila]ADN01281.1 hypothetical membrane protein [Spirochaeta thermophila DSM 6192]
MRPFCVFVWLVSVGVGGLWALDGWAFSSSLETSWFTGEAHELVYQKWDEGDHLLSRLVWPAEGWLLEAEAGLSWWRVGIEGWYAFLVGGREPGAWMEDYDYMNLGDPDPTHFSTHPVELGPYREIGGGLSFRIVDRSAVRISLGAGWEYLHRYWSAHDGYAQYPSGVGDPYDPSSGTGWPYPEWTGDEPKSSFDGEVITYEQEVMGPVLLFRCGMRPSTRLEAETSVMWSPYPLAVTLDEHVLRDILFLDKMAGGVLLDVSGELQVFLWKGLSLYGRGWYRLVSMAKGDSYFKEEGTWYQAADGKSGMESTEWGLGMGMRVMVE